MELGEMLTHEEKGEFLSLIRKEYKTEAFALGSGRINALIDGEEVQLVKATGGQLLDLSFAFTVIKDTLEVASLVATIYTSLKSKNSGITINIDDILKRLGEDSKSKSKLLANKDFMTKFLEMLKKRK